MSVNEIIVESAIVGKNFQRSLIRVDEEHDFRSVDFIVTLKNVEIVNLWNVMCENRF